MPTPQAPDIEGDEDDAAAARDHQLNVEILRRLTARGYHGVWTQQGVTVHPLSHVIDAYNARHASQSMSMRAAAQEKSSGEQNPPRVPDDEPQKSQIQHPDNDSEPPADPAPDIHSRPDDGLEKIKASNTDLDEKSVDPRAEQSSASKPASQSTAAPGETRKAVASAATALREAFVPPGQDQPGYVQIGTPGVASNAQGNHAGIDPVLRGQIVDAELDNEHRRPEAQRLSWAQITEKYNNWGKAQASLRWYNLRYTGAQYRPGSK